MWIREQRRVVALDARSPGRTGSTSTPEHPGRRSAGAAPGASGWARFTRRDRRSATASSGDDRGQPDERVERPAEQRAPAASGGTRDACRRGRATAGAERAATATRPSRAGRRARRRAGPERAGLITRRILARSAAFGRRAIWQGSTGRSAPARPLLGYDARVRRPGTGGARPRTARPHCWPGRAPAAGRQHRGTRCRCLPGHGPGPVRSSPALIIAGVVASAWSACWRQRRSRRSACGTASSRSTARRRSRTARRAPGAVRLRVLHRASSIFVLVEALIIFTVVPLPAQADDDGAAAPDPRQQPRRGGLDGDPDRDRRCSCSCSRGRRSTPSRPRPPSDVHVRAVAARFQWSFDYLDADGETVLFTQQLPVGEDGGWSSRSASRSTSTCAADGRDPRLLRARSSCSSGTSCRARSTCSTSRSRRPGTYRGQCAELCGTYHGSMLFEVHARRPRPTSTPGSQQQIEQANADARRPPPSGGAAGAGPLDAARAKDIDVLDGRARRRRPTRRSRSTSRTRTRAAAQRRDQGRRRGAAGLQGRDHHRAGEGASYAVPPLKAGTYTFVCTVHPNMTGTLTVQ